MLRQPVPHHFRQCLVIDAEDEVAEKRAKMVNIFLGHLLGLFFCPGGDDNVKSNDT